MKILFIGGTGNISTPVSQKLITEGHTLYLLNRGQRATLPGAISLPADVKNPAAVQEPSLRGPLFGDKMYSVIFDNSAVKRLVPDFVAKIPLHAGLRRTAAWFDADPARQRVNAEHEALLQRCLSAWNA